ncbi:MAG: glycosyltransferase [Phycisphaerales bacterium]|nr:glycosyltransferase [Phycisphaerales bacterium]
MDEAATFEIDSSIFDANLTALRTTLSASAEHIASAQAPSSLSPAIGRDGATTFSWLDESRDTRWLGRTSMPTISTEALVNAFRPGPGNVFLFGLGQGGEVWRLLRRLSAHQAVLVIDETPWAIGAALRLYDFAADIRKKRLLIFTGAEPWDDCRRFLVKHSGFLTPERVLSWPWFEPHTVTQISNRLTALQAAVSRDRTSLKVSPEKGTTIVSKGPAIALLSNLADPRIHRLAHNLAASATRLGWPCERHVLDNPSMVSPQAVKRVLDEFAPQVAVFIDVLPETLPYAVPDVPGVILCSHSKPLSDHWLRQISMDTAICVQTDAQRRQAIDCGLPETQILLLPPAAVPGQRHEPVHGRQKILVVGDMIDPSAQSAGLHLASHCRLWDAAADLINEKIDTYQDEQAESILASAERRLGIRLESDEVRQGIGRRIEQRLGPTLIRRAYCAALAEAGVAFDWVCTSWATNETPPPYYRGLWPSAGEHAALLADYGLIISLETSGEVLLPFLDALAAGLPGLARGHPRDKSPDGFAAVLDPDEHILCFGSRSDLVNQISLFFEQPDAHQQRARRATRHINADHTWDHRLQHIVERVQATK